MTPHRPGLPRRRRGFTVVEMTVVSLMTAILAVVMASVWSNFCKPALEAAARCRMAAEANLAVASIARDFGGNLPDPAGRLGAPLDGRFTGRMMPDSDWLRLCYHGGSDTDAAPKWSTPDTIIGYRLDGDRLVRTDETSGAQVVLAAGLTGFAVSENVGVPGVVIVLTFKARGLTATYSVVALDPPAS